MSADIGTVGVTGLADETSGTFTINGAGADIGGTADGFHYVYQSLAGDGEIIANVVSLTGGGSVPKAGLMIRESLAADAVHVSAVVQGNRIQVYERTSTGGNTTSLNGYTQGTPEWIRIVRMGNTFDLYHSNNGTSWLLMQSRTVTMGTNVYIGTAVTGNSTTTLATGTFNSVSVTGGGGGATATPTATSTATATPTDTPTPGATPTATTTASPTPTPTATTTPPPSQPEVIVQRTTYSIAGQTVFLRLRTLEDGLEVSSDLYALHSDQLGSTSTLSYLNPTDGSASRVLDSRAFYTPFGDYRLQPTGDYTDRGYTGQKENMDIGLIYYNARFYVPGIGRFASADTIVPNPANPQSFNRFSYVRNNPLKYTDPTGYCAEIGDESCWSFAEQTASEFGIPLEFVGVMNMAQMRLFIQGLNAANEMDSGLLDQITTAINGIDSEEWSNLRWLADNTNWDIFGIRITAGGGFGLAGEGALDFVFNWDSWEFSIMGSLGGSVGLTIGGSGGGGFIYGFNAPDNSVMWDWSWGINGEAAYTGGIGFEYSESIGNDASFFTVKALAGTELDVSVGVSYTWEIYRYMPNASGNEGYGLWFPKRFYKDGFNYGQ